MKFKILFILIFILSGCSTGQKIINIFTSDHHQPDFIHGLIDFELSCEKSAKVPVGFDFSEQLPPNVQWVFVNPNAGNYIIPHTLSGDRKTITITIQDGGAGDLLTRPDGKIYHVGGPAVK